MWAGARKRRTQQLCFARSKPYNDAGRMNFICSSLAMAPIERYFASCNCELTIFHGFATASILASSPDFIVRLIFLFIPVFRKRLALQPWNARHVARRWWEFAVATWIT